MIGADGPNCVESFRSGLVLAQRQDPPLRQVIVEVEFEVCERTALSGFRVHSRNPLSELSVLIDLATKSSRHSCNREPN